MINYQIINPYFLHLQAKLNQQISEVADIIKGMFSKEELKQMEDSFNVFKELNEQKEKDGNQQQDTK